MCFLFGKSNVFQQSYKCFATSGKSGLICVDVNGFLLSSSDTWLETWGLFERASTWVSSLFHDLSCLRFASNMAPFVYSAYLHWYYFLMFDKRSFSLLLENQLVSDHAWSHGEYTLFGLSLSVSSLAMVSLLWKINKSRYTCCSMCPLFFFSFFFFF